MKRIAIGIYLLLSILSQLNGQNHTWYRAYQEYPNQIDGHPVSIHDMAEDNLGYQWITTNNGLYRFDGYDYTLAPTSVVDSLAAGSVLPRFVAHYQEGFMVLGTSYGFVDLFSTTHGTTERWDLFKDHDLLQKNIISAIRVLHVGKDGTIWAGTSLGLRKLRPGSSSIQTYQPYPDPDRIENWGNDPNIVWSICENTLDSNQLLIGTQGGLGVLDKMKGQFVQTFLDGKAVNYVFQDTATGLIYATAWGEGLFEIDPITGVFQQYPLDPLEFGIWSILKINQDTLLLSGGAYGFYFYDMTRKQLFYNSEPIVNIALHSSGILQAGHYIDRRGYLWFRKGSHRLRIALHGRINKLPPLVRATSITAPEMHPLRVQDNELVILPRGVRSCQIKFAAINPIAPDSVSYAYRLDSGEWIETGTNRHVAFSNLTHGAHDVYIKASSPTEFESSEARVAQITVSLPLWQQPLARILGLIGIAGVLTLIWITRSRQIKSKQRIADLEKSFAELELSALRAQMNPHFLFNSLNSIRNFILLSERREAADYLSRFAHLIRMILQHSREQYISLQEELDALLLYIDLEKLRFEDEFAFNCVIDKAVDLHSVQIPPMILQPYIENAIWHGLMHKDAKGTLSLTISANSEYVDCIIEDDGVGRAKSQELKSKTATRHKSMGLGITKDRIEIHNRMHDLGIRIHVNDMVSDDGTPEGTKVVVSIPAKQ